VTRYASVVSAVSERFSKQHFDNIHMKDKGSFVPAAIHGGSTFNFRRLEHAPSKIYVLSLVNANIFENKLF
jgi:hypothetical protein